MSADVYEIRVGRLSCVFPSLLFAIVLAVALRFGITWTAARIVVVALIGIACGATSYTLWQLRLGAGPIGLDRHTWRGKSGFVWEDVGRFHCDGKRLVLIDLAGAVMFELDVEEPYANSAELMQRVVAQLERRAIPHRRRESLQMTQTETYVLDRLHRYWPVLLVALAVVLATTLPWTAQTLLALAGLAALGAGLIWLNRRVTLTIGPQGIVDRGWLVTADVRWAQVASYSYDEESSVFSISQSMGFGDMLFNILASLFIRLPRALLRRLYYGRRPTRFFRGSLELRDTKGHTLWTLRARDGHANIEAAFDRILDELAERAVTFTEAA